MDAQSSYHLTPSALPPPQKVLASAYNAQEHSANSAWETSAYITWKTSACSAWEPPARPSPPHVVLGSTDKLY